MPSLAIDLIDPPTQNVRKIPASKEQDDELQSSLAELGLLQPILVRPTGERYEILDGERRWRVGKLLGWDTISAEVSTASGAQWWPTAAGAAANMVRAPMNPVDTWRAMGQLQAQGYTLQGACSALGLSERKGRRLDRLSKLHPDVLAHLEAGDWPRDFDLAAIAGAKPADQAHALKSNRRGKEVIWSGMAGMLRNQRIPASWALFDIQKSGVPFEEDLFASADDEMALYTTNHTKFIKAQSAALEAIIATPPKGVTYAVAELDQWGHAKLPKHAVRVYGLDWRKAKKGHTVYFEARQTGEVVAVVVTVPPQPKKEPKAKAEKRKPGDPIDEIDDNDETEAPAPAPAQEASPSAGVTKLGLDIIAAAKTEALRTTLESLGADLRPEVAIAALVLLLTAPNVSIHGPDTGELRGLRGRLVSPIGTLQFLDTAGVSEIAARALELCLRIPGADPDRRSYRDDTGPVGEWIGHAINASRALPRFDTPQFLATVSSGPLIALAHQLGMKPAKKIADLRAQLAGKAPDWRPTQSQFGEAGPAVEEPYDG